MYLRLDKDHTVTELSSRLRCSSREDRWCRHGRSDILYSLLWLFCCLLSHSSFRRRVACQLRVTMYTAHPVYLEQWRSHFYFSISGIHASGPYRPCLSSWGEGTVLYEYCDSLWDKKVDRQKYFSPDESTLHQYILQSCTSKSRLWEAYSCHRHRALPSICDLIVFL